MGSIGSNLQEVKQRIGRAAHAAGRSAQSVTLLAVSKTFDAGSVRQALAAGQHAFGENYVQEALSKIDALADQRAQLEWHLIGPLQSNKTRPVAEAFDWVHTIDRLKVAERLAEQRPAGLAPLQLCFRSTSAVRPAKAALRPATWRPWPVPWPRCRPSACGSGA